MKNKFKVFLKNISGRYGRKAGRFFRIACAVLNFQESIAFTFTDRKLDFATRALKNAKKVNPLFKKLKDGNFLGLQGWRLRDAEVVSGFPKLSLDEIETITCGPYQVAIALRYIKYHMKDGRFKIRLHEKFPNIIRCQLPSRMESTEKRSAFVEFDWRKKGPAAVTGYYCMCKSGPRTSGSCGHVAAVSHLY